MTEPTRKLNKTILINDFLDSTTIKELCNFFKKEGNIRDIILPQKKEKNNNIFGFVVARNGHEADKLITKLNRTPFNMGKKFSGLSKRHNIKNSELNTNSSTSLEG